MSAVSFLLKKAQKNKFNLLPLFLILAFLIFIYYGNYASMKLSEDPAFSGENEIAPMEAAIANMEQSLQSLPETSESYQILQERLDTTKQRLEALQNKLTAKENADWQAYYQNDAALIRVNLATEQQSEEMKAIRNLNIAFDEYCYNHQIAYDDRFSPVQGISFLSDVLHKYLPVLLTISIIFIFSSLACSSYYDGFDIQMLLPIPKWKKQGVRELAGWIIGGAMFLFICIVAIICGSLGMEFGTFSSPILQYTMEGADTFVPFTTILLPSLLLCSLAILWIVNLISFLSIYIRKPMSCMLISLLLVLGGLLVLGELAPLQPFLHLLPTTYLQAFQVASGELAFASGNANITLVNGLLSLLLGNLILFLLTMLCSQQTMKRGKLS